MDDFELPTQAGTQADTKADTRTDAVPLFAYPARLVVSGGGAPGDLSLAVLIKDISHTGASLEFEASRVPEGFTGRSVKLHFVGAAGAEVEIAGRVEDLEMRGAQQAAARVAFVNIHLPQVEEIRALRASPRKDRRLLWDLWDSLQEGGS